MLRIVDADYIDKFILHLTFNDGSKKEVDLSGKLTGKMFESLNDESLFIQYGLFMGTIQWANGADFAPEYLYSIGKEITIETKKNCA